MLELPLNRGSAKADTGPFNVGAEMKIFVVEDSPSIKRALVRRLEQQLARAQVVGEATHEAPAVALISWLQPDVVLLDLSLADGGSGLQVLRQIRQRGFKGRVLVLSSESAELYRGPCLKAGAQAYYDKAEGLDGLLADLKALTDTDSADFPGSALRDGPTGLPSAEALIERLDLATQIAERDDTPLAVCVLQLPGLADMPPAGARAMAERLAAVCESSDILARPGPEQLALVMTRAGSAAASAAFAAQLVELLQQEGAAPAAVRIGMARFPDDAIAPRSLLSLAQAQASGVLPPAQGAGRSEA